MSVRTNTNPRPIKGNPIEMNSPPLISLPALNLDPPIKEADRVNACWCYSCRRIIPLGLSPTYAESESWELPKVYYVNECPLCDDGGEIDDYTKLHPLALWYVTLWVKLLIDLKTIRQRP